MTRIRTKRTIRIQTATLFSAVAILTFSFSAHAENKLLSLSLQELTSIEVSSSTRTRKTLKTAPSSMTVYTRAQIATMPVHYLHELMNFVPGFQSFRQAEAADEYYHSSRGRRVGTSSREVLILINGVRYNRHSDGALATPGILLNNIAKVEFIRGPGSALYGSNAFMGVINIDTVTGENNVQLELADNNRTQVSVLANTAFYEWAADISIITEQDPGETFSLENMYSQTLEAIPDKQAKNDIRLMVGNHKTQIEAVYQQRNTEQYYVVEHLGGKENTTENSHYHFSAKHAAQLGELDFELHANLTNNQYRPNTQLAPAGFSYAYGGSVPPSNEPLRAHLQQSENSRTVNVYSNWAAKETLSFQGGIEYRHVSQDESNLNTNFNLDLIPIEYLGETNTHATTIAEKSQYEVYGGFLQTLLQASANVEIVLGGRYDHYTEIKSSLSPRAALTWQLGQHHSLKFLYGEAFRAPTTNELHFTDNNTLLGNPNLEPETVSTREINWLFSKGKFHFATSLFLNRISHAIEQDFIDTTRTFVNRQANQTTKGIESEFSLWLNTYWQLHSNITLLTELPASQFRQADNLASIRLNYHHKQWQWHLSAQYNSARIMDSPNGRLDVDGYSLFHSRLDYSFNHTHQISLMLKNLTDKNYLTPPQGQVLTQGLSNRGRELSLRYSFNF